MPRGRMLNKKISQDDRVSKLSLEGSLLYTWCIPYLDIKGRIYGDVWTLKSIVPNIKELTPQKIEKCIQEFINADLVLYYGDNQKYLQFKGFNENQTLREDRESKSEIPTPPDKLQQHSSETPGKDKLSKVNISKDNTYVAFEQATLATWNRFCKKYPSFSCLKQISDKRRNKLKLRFGDKTFRDSFTNYDIYTAIEEQDFCRGENDRNWKVSFDWLIENDTNYLKVLEYKYKKEK